MRCCRDRSAQNKAEPQPEPARDEPKANGAGSGSSVTSGQNLLAKPEPTATTAKSWKVEAIAKDGKRYGNGVRFRTEEEADAYRANASLDLMKENGVIVTASEVIPCEDAPSGAFMKRAERGRFKGRFKETLSFLHGTCGTLDWKEIATPASGEKTEANPNVEAWDKASPAQRREFIWTRMPQQQIGEATHNDIPPSAPADDYPDMPDSLRRTLEAA